MSYATGWAIGCIVAGRDEWKTLRGPISEADRRAYLRACKRCAESKEIPPEAMGEKFDSGAMKALTDSLAERGTQMTDTGRSTSRIRRISQRLQKGLLPPAPERSGNNLSVEFSDSHKKASLPFPFPRKAMETRRSGHSGGLSGDVSGRFSTVSLRSEQQKNSGAGWSIPGGSE